MTDLTALTPALPASPIMPNPPAEAAENGELAGIDFAALLGLQLSAAPLVQVRAASTSGKDSPASGKTLPDLEPTAPDASEGSEADPLDVVLLPTVVAMSLPFAPAASDPSQPTELPVEKGPAQPQAAPPPMSRDPAAALTLPIHAAPRAAEALAGRLDLRFEAQPAKLTQTVAQRSAKIGSPQFELPAEIPRADLPEQASARAVEVHAARLSGLRPAPASPEAGEGKPAPANPAVPRPKFAIAPIAQGPSSDAAPQGRPGKAPTEQVAVPQVSLPASVTEAPPLVATPAAQAHAPSAPIATVPDVEAPRADFAALVDRLAEARDAAGVEPVRLALRHAEFGQVALQIRPDDSGLSVTMASPDPDFARAVSVAVPAASGAQGGESLPQSDNGPSRSSGGASSGSDPGSPNRGSTTPERRASEDRHRPALARPDRDPSGDTRSGIFA